MTIKEARQLLNKKEISAVELAKSCLKNIENKVLYFLFAFENGIMLLFFKFQVFLPVIFRNFTLNLGGSQILFYTFTFLRN